jgi:uncharacterized protein
LGHSILETDLNKPLGRPGQKPVARSKSRLLAGFLAICLFGGIIGLSVYAFLEPKPLQTTVVAAKPATDRPADVSAGAMPPDGVDKNSSVLAVEGGKSGANIRQTITEDGSVVTTYSPKDRDSNGAVMLQPDGTRREDPRFPGVPYDALLEDSEQGRLPIVGPDGLKPLEYYGRPWSGARGPRVAIVVGGLGLSQTGTQNAIRDLPEEITLAFAASGNSLQRWLQEARRNGHEVLLQVPMEPFDYPDNDPGPATLLTSKSAKANLANLHKAMGQITNYTGILNFLGGRFLSDPDALEPVMRDIGKRGLMFLDDGSSAQSLSGPVAKAIDMPHAFADVQLDATVNKDAILRKLDELERIANAKGSAIGVASAFDESVAAIAQWSAEAAKHGVEIVGVSVLSNEPVQQ